MTKLEPIVKQVEHEQDDEIKAQYGQQLLTELAKELTKAVGRGFSKSNLYNMRNFYLEYQIFQTVSGKLTWSHYCELLGLNKIRNKESTNDTN